MEVKKHKIPAKKYYHLPVILMRNLYVKSTEQPTNVTSQANMLNLLNLKLFPE